MVETPGQIYRRHFLGQVAAAGLIPAAGLLSTDVLGAFGQRSAQAAGQDLRKDWLARWERNILNDARNRYCDREMGEEIGWLISPFLSGFYCGYQATHEGKWVDLLMDWADAWIKRGMKEPDGYTGWPKADGASTSIMPGLYTDNLLGDAMGLRPVVLMADRILKTPALKERHGQKAEEYIHLAEQVFEKWTQRGCWREVKGGGLWVVPPFGIDCQAGKWTEGYERRNTDGFSLPANKQNLIALWLLAMHEVTKKPRYRERAEQWWRVMKARMRLQEDGKFFVWNYWDPAGPWDYKPDGSAKHWVGVHPNGGYYAIDLEGIVAAYEHGLVFSKEDLGRLVATNRDFMWNQQIEGAKFRRIDGGKPDPRWKDTPGVLWMALVPYDTTLRKVFEANHKPDSWGGLATTPWYFAHHTITQPTAATLPSGHQKTVLRDKWDLWSGSTSLRGANIWQKRVNRNDVMGKGPVGPPYSQQDLDQLAAWGANYVNISHPGIFTEKPEYRFDPGVFQNLTELIDRAQRAGLFVVVAYRTGPGRNEAVFGGEEEKKLDAVWSSQPAQDAWVQMWRDTARQLKDRSAVVGYDLMVEPETQNHRLWNEMARKITRGIREVDHQMPILVGAADWSTVDSLDLLQVTGDPRTVYVVHQYEPYGYSHQKRKGSAYSPRKLEEVYRKLQEFKSQRKVPLAVNEFGAVRYAPDVNRFIEDQMRHLESLGANHALWLWETSFRLNYDQFNFRHGPDRKHHIDVPTSLLSEVIKQNWSLNRIRPEHSPETP